MPRVHDVVPVLDVDGVVEALTVLLQSTSSGGLHCPRAAQLRVLFHMHAHTNGGLSLIAHVEGIVSFMFLGGGACSDYCSLGWAVMASMQALAINCYWPFGWCWPCRQD